MENSSKESCTSCFEQKVSDIKTFSGNLKPLWTGYFEESVKLSSFRVYITRPKPSSFHKASIQTFFVMHHGAGSCGLSFACLAKEITSMVDSECGILTYDARGHGDSDDILKDGKIDLRLDELCKDLVRILELVNEYFGYENPFEVILVGHSLGGAVVAHVAKKQLISNIIGCVVLDIVEGSVINSFPMMIHHFSKRPRAFDTIQQCIDWHLKNKVIRNEQSAHISIPMLLKKQSPQDAIYGKWAWRVNLGETRQFWYNWFSGLSECFLSVSSPKLLILSNTDRLDKTLMIAQMQGKFQLITLNQLQRLYFLIKTSFFPLKIGVFCLGIVFLFCGIVGVVKFGRDIGICASSEADEAVQLPNFKSTEVRSAGFVEQFTEGWQNRWVISSALRRIDGNNTMFYDGEWSVEEPSVYKGINGDMGLVVKKAAAHHAISAKFEKSMNNKGKILVVQYEVKLQNDLECGGAYLKLITESREDIRFKDFSNQTPYTIMFGPDKCGMTNKVHFIFRHKNPKTGKYEEKHLKSPPTIEETKFTTLYTLIVRPDQSFEIRINNKPLKKGSLLKDFDPPVNPEKFIVDPDDKKPDDWVDEATIIDVNAKKPDDWDENEPPQILDVNAVKPTNWLEDEPLMIPDPNASAPEEWNEEEDGEYIAPMIPNPACAKAAGCGPFRPMIPNPKYKGLWVPPRINNPKYIGEWVPHKTPSDFESLIGIGFELWTMQNDILFDNIYIGHSIEEAEKFAKATFEVKYKHETAQKKVDSFETPSPSEIPEASYLDVVLKKATVFIDLVKRDPISALKEMPGTASTMGTLFLTLIAIFYGIISLISTYSKFDSSTETKIYESETIENDNSKNNMSDENHDSLESETVASTKKRAKRVE
ncbi:hypothetical protein PORY_000254 [Pneumocystis oryctolagi]|uniref:Uncharacterized protein n=1 Tax=Pneumocystis oryctolagi TaxID=42067 RepID=A0ACB7CFA4_9ASCO|nr:hypothetical protein PORY_000254 [Pneumocystis oryctolagi]